MACVASDMRVSWILSTRTRTPVRRPVQTAVHNWLYSDTTIRHISTGIITGVEVLVACAWGCRSVLWETENAPWVISFLRDL